MKKKTNLTIAVPKYWKYRAKPSFNHVCSHQSQVTKSPNHMCACSWATTEATRCCAKAVETSGSYRSAVSRNVNNP